MLIPPMWNQLYLIYYFLFVLLSLHLGFKCLRAQAHLRDLFLTESFLRDTVFTMPGAMSTQQQTSDFCAPYKQKIWAPYIS